MKKTSEMKPHGRSVFDRSKAMANASEQNTEEGLIEIQDNRHSTLNQRSLDNEVNSHLEFEPLISLQRKVNKVNEYPPENGSRIRKNKQTQLPVDEPVVQRIVVKENDSGELKNHTDGRKLIAMTLLSSLSSATQLDKKLIKYFIETEIDTNTKEYLNEKISGNESLAEIQAIVDKNLVGSTLPASRQRSLGTDKVIILKNSFSTILNLYQSKLRDIRTKRPLLVKKIMTDGISDETLHGGQTLVGWETKINQELLYEGQFALDDTSEVQLAVKTLHQSHQNRYTVIQTEVGKLQTIRNQSLLPGLPTIPQAVQTQKQLQQVVDAFKSHYQTLTNHSNAIDSNAANRSKILDAWRNDVGAVLTVTVTLVSGSASGGHSNLYNIAWNKFGIIDAGTQSMPNTNHGLDSAITGNQRSIQSIQTDLNFMIKKDTDVLTPIQTTISGWSAL